MISGRKTSGCCDLASTDVTAGAAHTSEVAARNAETKRVAEIILRGASKRSCLSTALSLKVNGASDIDCSAGWMRERYEQLGKHRTYKAFVLPLN